jgi:pre-mRNA-splicing helicase BRR2
MTFIQQSAARLFRCLFELAWKKRWASVAVKLLELAVMVDRKLWRSQSPLRQFTAIPEVLVRKLERISDIPWEKYYDLTPQDFGDMVKMPKMGKTLHKFVHMLPRLHIDLRAYPISRSLLRLDIECTPDFEFQEAVHGRSVVFWLMVEDGDGQQLLHIEPITLFSTKNSCRSSCTVPLVEPLPPQYFLRVVADRWLHAHQIIPISFKHLILPEKFPLPTPVLDLKPVTTSLITDKRVREFLEDDGITTFNSLQTQAYHAVYEMDTNVLICAPSGAGKQTCLDLSLLRYLTTFYNAEEREATGQSLARKALYVCPHQDWCISLCRDWAPKLSVLFPGMTVVLLTGDTLADYEAMKHADVVVATPENWNLISTKWKQRKIVQQIGLYLFDHVELISAGGVLAGDVSSAAYEMVVSRSRFIATTVYQQMQEDDEDEEDAEMKKWKFPARFVACGYAAANAKDVGEWLGVHSSHSFYFAPQQSPGTVSMSFHASDHHDQSVRISSVSKHLFSAVGSVHRQSSKNVPKTLVFVPTRKLARLTAIDLISYANNRNLQFTSHQEGDGRGGQSDDQHRKVSLPSDLAQKLRSLVQDAALKEVLSYGVGYMYEGQSASEQQFMQELLRLGFVTVLIVPFRVSHLVLSRAEYVFVLDTQYFDGKVGLEIDVETVELLHMVGRARHSSHRGHVQVYCPASKREHLERCLVQLMPVESRLHTQLGDHLLTEMVSRTIETKADSVDFLTWTFLYRRLPKNPNFYGLLGTSVRHISDYLSELVEESITDLADNKFVAVEDNEMDVSPLNLGMICVYYGLMSDTIAIVANSLTAKSRIKAMLEVISCALEWEEKIPIRAQEWGMLVSLAKQVAQLQSSSGNGSSNNSSEQALLARLLGQEKDENALSDTARKVLILLLSYQRRLSLSYDLVYDVAQVLRGVGKMLHATVDVLASQGWLKASLAAMELHQCLVQGMHESDSPLLQLPHLTAKHVRLLRETHGVESVVDFLQLEDEARMAFLQEGFSTQQVSDVARFCNAYPSIEVAFDLPGLESEEGNEDELVYSVRIEDQTSVKVVAQITRDNIDEDEESEETLANVGKVVSQRYPQTANAVKREEWWLLVGDAKQNILYGIKRFTLARRAQVKIDFELPNDLSSIDALQLKLYLMCDSYLGCDQEYDFTLRLN